ncbi:ABC transporter substrate-binding protein [Desulfococcaceae bacterium HSG8]|nr:ABC transporter substrate-binding protein [Desulfococcaceae bacterium HSG8]
MRQSPVSRREFLKKTVAGCAAFTIGFPSIALSKTTLKIGYLPILDHLALMVSHVRENDSLREISVEPMRFKSWRAAVNALKSGVIDGAFLLSNLAMDQFAKGVDIRSVLVAHRNGSGITVKKDSPINSPADLKGKNIGIPAKISTHTALLDKYLRQGGLSLTDVNTRGIAPPNMIPALKENRIDAFIVAEPFCAKAETEGIGRTLVLSKDILSNHICCTVVVRNQVLKANPTGIREWVGSLKRNGSFIDQDKVKNGGKTIARLARKYVKFDEKIIIAGMMNPNDRVTYTDMNPEIADYQAILDMSRDAGLIGNIDLSKFVDNSFYKNISRIPGLELKFRATFKKLGE